MTSLRQVVRLRRGLGDAGQLVPSFWPYLVRNGQMIQSGYCTINSPPSTDPHHILTAVDNCHPFPVEGQPGDLFAVEFRNLPPGARIQAQSSRGDSIPVGTVDSSGMLQWSTPIKPQDMGSWSWTFTASGVEIGGRTQDGFSWLTTSPGSDSVPITVTGFLPNVNRAIYNVVNSAPIPAVTGTPGPAAPVQFVNNGVATTLSTNGLTPDTNSSIQDFLRSISPGMLAPQGTTGAPAQTNGPGSGGTGSGSAVNTAGAPASATSAGSLASSTLFGVPVWMLGAGLVGLVVVGGLFGGKK